MRECVVVVLLPILLSGCLSVRVAAAPTLDTRKQPGAEGQVLLSFGFGENPTWMAAPVMGSGVGNGGQPLLMSGLEVAATTRHRGCLASRLGGRFMNRNFFSDESTFLFGGGLLGGVYGLLADHHDWLSRTEIRLGAEAQAELHGGDGLRGYFALPLVFEVFVGLEHDGFVPCVVRDDDS